MTEKISKLSAVALVGVFIMGLFAANYWSFRKISPLSLERSSIYFSPHRSWLKNLEMQQGERWILVEKKSDLSCRRFLADITLEQKSPYPYLKLSSEQKDVGAIVAELIAPKSKEHFLEKAEHYLGYPPCPERIFYGL